MFFRREHLARDRYLPLKLGALLAGGLLGLIGMRIDNPLVVDVAIVVVLLGFLLRFLPQRTAVSGVGDRVSGGHAPTPDTRNPTPP